MIGLPFSRVVYVLQPLKHTHCATLSALHAQLFAQVWSEEDFESLLGQSNVFGFLAVPVGKPNAGCGFVLARLVAGEAEILTIAVAPNAQRRGIGRDLMEGVLRKLHQERAESLFLEVDETNIAAQVLYKRLGFVQVGYRPSYYDSGSGRSGALILRREVSKTS